MAVLVLLRHDGHCALRRYGCVLVVSYGNTLRALIKHLEAVSDDAVSALEVPNATPFCYELPAGSARPGRLVTS